MYYVTTKAAVSPFALLGEHASRADARQMAKELGGTCRTQDEYDVLVALHAVEAPAKKPSAPIGAALEKDAHSYSCPHCGIDLDNGVGGHGDDVNGKTTKHAAYEYACLGCGEEFGPAIVIKAEKKAPSAKVEIVNESTAERPCKLVWHIADEMTAANPAVRRKDVLAACVARGVAFYTARTQYQQWLGIQKEMAAREAAQAAK